MINNAFTVARSNIINLSKKSFVRNVFVVASGTVIAQIITMAFLPIISRLYGPEAFGLFGSFAAMTAVITPVAALTYPAAIVLSKSDSDARVVARLSLYISLMFAGFSAIIILFFGNSISDLLQLQEIRSFLWLIPLVLIFSAWVQVNQQWLIRKQYFKLKAKLYVFQAFITHCSKSVVGLFNPVGAALIILYILGQAFHALMINIGLRRKSELMNELSKPISIENIKSIARRHYDFPFYRAPQLFITAASGSIPILIITAFFGPVSAGLFVMCKKILYKPTELIGNSVGDVFYPTATKTANDKKMIAPLIIKSTIGLVVIGLPILSLFVFFGPSLFRFVLGQDWEVAGNYAQWISLWTFMVLVDKPTIRTLPIISAQGFYLVYTIISRILSIIVFMIVAYLYKSAIIAIATLSIFYMLHHSLVIVVVIFKSIKYDQMNRPQHNNE